MHARAAILALCVGLGSAVQAEALAFDGPRTFSGVSDDSGAGLIAPPVLTAGGPVSFGAMIDTGADSLSLFATASGGEIDSGLRSFPMSSASEFSFNARLAADDLFWGLTPYIGLGVSGATGGETIFQGIPKLLPYAGDTLGVHGVAGVTYEVIPGVGAGVEYRYTGYGASAPVPGATSDQTIMMRLDLGLN